MVGSMSWDTQVEVPVRVREASAPPPSGRLSDTVRVHIEQARRAARADGGYARLALRLPVPSFFAIGVALGVLFALLFATAMPRAASAATRRAATAHAEGARVFILDRPTLRERATPAAPATKHVALRARTTASPTAPRRLPVRTDAILDNALAP
jgi:hypothetical protein